MRNTAVSLQMKLTVIRLRNKKINRSGTSQKPTGELNRVKRPGRQRKTTLVDDWGIRSVVKLRKEGKSIRLGRACTTTWNVLRRIKTAGVLSNTH